MPLDKGEAGADGGTSGTGTPAATTATATAQEHQAGRMGTNRAAKTGLTTTRGMAIGKTDMEVGETLEETTEEGNAAGAQARPLEHLMQVAISQAGRKDP